MNQTDIYGPYRPAMEQVLREMLEKIEACHQSGETMRGEKLCEHITSRIKSGCSMTEKLRKQGLEPTTFHALRAVTDAIGIRIVCLFIDDIYENVKLMKALPGCRVIQEKDYIRQAKPNGYRSYHLILEAETDASDVDGHRPGHYYVEVQLRTIAMDTWAALEHELKYKKTVRNPEMIARELQRCANELAACDVSMQTLKHIIRER